jgi:hypothetical protein
MIEAAEIRIIGDSLTPSNFDIKDLAEVLAGIDDVLINTASPENEKPKVCLQGIQEGSVKLQLVTAATGVLAITLPFIGDSIANGNTSKLPYKARQSIVALQGKIKKKKYSIELPTRSGCTILSSDTRISFSKPVKGITELRARVLRAGGKHPKGMFEAPSGDELYVDLTPEQAKLCGKHLYGQVKLKGIGSWNPETLELIAFKAESVIPVETQDIEATFDRLGSLLAAIKDEDLTNIRQTGDVL